MNKTIAALYGSFFGFFCRGWRAGLCKPFAPSIAAQSMVLDQDERIGHMFGAIVFAPFLETVIFQLGIIELAKHWFKERRMLPLILSTLMFSAMHLVNGFEQAINMILFGAALVMIYGAFRKHSVAHAFVATFSTHTTHNLLLVLAAILFPQFVDTARVGCELSF
jgi:membrane protease YdiL (CAAX protease family)